MKWQKFLLFNLIGASLWIGLWICAASFLSYDKVLLIEVIKKSEYIFPLIFALPFLSAWIYKIIRKLLKN